MERKQKRREMIDEDYIRNLIGGVDAPPKLVPKQAPAESSPKTPPQEAGDRSRQAVAPTDKEEGGGKQRKLWTVVLATPEIQSAKVLPDRLWTMA